MSANSSHHYVCTRCGKILKNFPEAPSICPACGGVEVIDIGEEGAYSVKDLRKKYHLPFRPDIYLDYQT